MSSITSLADNQKGIDTVQQYSFQNQKGAIAIALYSNSALLVLNGISLKSDKVIQSFWVSTEEMYILQQATRHSSSNFLRASFLKMREMFTQIIVVSRRISASISEHLYQLLKFHKPSPQTRMLSPSILLSRANYPSKFMITTLSKNSKVL